LPVALYLKRRKSILVRHIQCSFLLTIFYRYSNNSDHVQPNEESLAALLHELTVGECMGEFAANIVRARFIPSWRQHIWFSKKTLKLCSCVGLTSTMIWVCVAETGFLSLRMRVFPSVKLSLLLSLYKAFISPFLRLQPSFFCPLSWEIPFPLLYLSIYNDCLVGLLVGKWFLSIISFKFLCLLFTRTTIVLTSS